MVVTRACHLDSVAATLFELADIVEQTGLNAGDVGEMLMRSCSDSSDGIDQQTQADLFELCDSRTSAADFARGLRRQAEQLTRDADATLP